MSDPRFPGEHGEWDALAVGWALSALHPDDEQRFADHLPGCARCTATVREALYTVADLAYGVPDEPPPPALKSRLMAAVAAEPRPVPAEDEQWPLGAPHPGTPGPDPADWFAARANGNAPAPPAHRPDQPYRLDDLPGVPSHFGDRPPRPAGPDLPSHLGDRPDAPPLSGDRPGLPSRFGDRSEAAGRAEVSPPYPGGPSGWDRAGPDGRTRGAGPGDGRGSDGAVPIRRVDADRPRVRGRHAAGPDDDVVVPFAPRRRPVRRFAAVAAVAAVLALLVGLGGWNLRLRSDRDELQQVVAQREAAISQLTANGPAKVAALTSSGQPSPTRKATVVVRGSQVEIVIETLGATTGDERYWLWTLNCDAKPKNLRAIRGFTVATSEFSVRDVGSDPGLGTATCFAISQETGTATPVTPSTVVALGKPG